MKRLFLLSLSWITISNIWAKEPEKVPVAIYFPEQVESIPDSAVNSLTNKLVAAVAQSGMGASDDFVQFYLTCEAAVVSRDIIPGAPTKYRQNADLTFYVVDAFSQKVFNAVTIPTNGVGNSEAKAYIACFQKIQPANKDLQNFLKNTNSRIIEYYESQIDNIINIAVSLAKVYKYDEALFRLSQYPEACKGYNRIVETATNIYTKYIDDKANRNLAKARAIWNAGQNDVAAEEAGQYLAEIMPEASCYGAAMALAEEIRSRVHSDIEYYRELEKRDKEYEREIKLANINAWKAVGVAFGNNQKAITYHREIFAH